MDQKKIGSFLKMLRNERHLTQEQLSEHFGVSARTVSRWETGSNMPDLGILIELSDYYDVDIRQILKGERKSEIMNEEKERLQMVAEYAEKEKQLLQRNMLAGSILSLVLLVVYMILDTDPYAEINFFTVEAFKGMILGFAMAEIGANILYHMGIWQKLIKKLTAIVQQRNNN